MFLVKVKKFSSVSNLLKVFFFFFNHKQALGIDKMSSLFYLYCHRVFFFNLLICICGILSAHSND